MSELVILLTHDNAEIRRLAADHLSRADPATRSVEQLLCQFSPPKQSGWLKPAAPPDTVPYDGLRTNETEKLLNNRIEMFALLERI